MSFQRLEIDKYLDGWFQDMLINYKPSVCLYVSHVGLVAKQHIWYKQVTMKKLDQMNMTYNNATNITLHFEYSPQLW